MHTFSLAQYLAVLAVPFLLAVTLHELAHGWVADRLGDPTAREAGRLTLNPLRHLDPLGVLALVLTQMFGWAKPVPVNPLRLRRPKQDMVWVALAGPAANLAIAVASSVALHGLAALDPHIAQHAQAGGGNPVLVPLYWMAFLSLRINVALAVFNCLPLPPLDGGRVLVGVLPLRAAMSVARIEPYGFLIVIALLVAGIVPKLIWPPIRFLIDLLS
ncbi:MAG TPA: site-2 protease family protein [bacterium]|jgi:Zn-dependent protease